MIDYIKAIYEGNPPRVTAVLASAIVAGLAKAEILVDNASVIEVLALVLPILLGGEVARQSVTPYSGETDADNDQLLNDAIKDGEESA